MDNLDFYQWFYSDKEDAHEMAGTGAVFDPKQKPKEDWNWEGAPGKTGVSPSKGPIIKKKK